MASASWKLCSMSGLHTPSASLSIGLSKASLPPESLLPSGEAGELHSEVMVPARSSKVPRGEADSEPEEYGAAGRTARLHGGGGRQRSARIWEEKRGFLFSLEF